MRRWKSISLWGVIVCVILSRTHPVEGAVGIEGRQAVSGTGVVWYVDDDAPGDPGPGDPGVSDPLEDGSILHPFDSIQEAIYSTTFGDTVIVADGTYTGAGNRDIDFLGRAITVRSENGPENCIIDCQGSEADPHRGFYFQNNENFNSMIDGFTIKNGYVSGDYPADCGGGIFCDNSSPALIRAC